MDCAGDRQSILTTRPRQLLDYSPLLDFFDAGARSSAAWVRSASTQDSTAKRPSVLSTKAAKRRRTALRWSTSSGTSSAPISRNRRLLPVLVPSPPDGRPAATSRMKARPASRRLLRCRPLPKSTAKIGRQRQYQQLLLLRCLLRSLLSYLLRRLLLHRLPSSAPSRRQVR